MKPTIWSAFFLLNFEFMKILKIGFYLLVITICLFGVQQMLYLNETLFKESKPNRSLELAWAEEFDESGTPNSGRWNLIVGDGCPDLCGFGNNEAQYYQSDKLKYARVENGKLVLEAHLDQETTNPIKSAKLTTKAKQRFRYGRIDVRAKNPRGRGAWPAIWMLSDKNHYGGWPNSGEIDIMEHVGYEPASIYGSIHTEAFNHKIGTQKSGEKLVPDTESEFHVYSVVWSPQKIEFQLDSTSYYEFLNYEESYKEWPFDQDFHLICNLAVGGDWGGRYGIDSTAFPMTFEIDYIRYYN